MFKKIISFFQGSVPEKDTRIYLSKIDKHMNFVLREQIGTLNKDMTSKIGEIEVFKAELIELLHELKHAKLMNNKILERERHIMEGNRDQYIQHYTRFIEKVQVPKPYLEMYHYCIAFSKKLEELIKETQKGVFILSHFYAEDLKAISKKMGELENKIIEIRLQLEKKNVEQLIHIQELITQITTHTLKIKDLNSQIIASQNEINLHQDKIKKLNERIATITSGTDYQALIAFKEQKAKAEEEFDALEETLRTKFSDIDRAMRKYYYKHPEIKLVKEYIDSPSEALLADLKLDVVIILKDLLKEVESNTIDLKDNASYVEKIKLITREFLEQIAIDMRKVKDSIGNAQTKITHNSASLNLSEQQYWLTNTQEKVKQHQAHIVEIQKNISLIQNKTGSLIAQIQDSLRTIMNEDIVIVDDVTQEILEGSISLN